MGWKKEKVNNIKEVISKAINRIKKIIKLIGYHKLSLFIVSYIILYIMLPKYEKFSEFSLKVNEIATIDIIAPFSFNILKTPEEYEQELLLAGNSVKPTFIYNSEKKAENMNEINAFLKNFENIYDRIKGQDSTYIKSQIRKFFESNDISVSNSTINIILKLGVAEFCNLCLSVADEILSYGYIKNLDEVDVLTNNKFVIIKDRGERLRSNIVTKDNLEYFIINNIKNEYKDNIQVIKALYEILISKLKYNLVFDRKVTLDEIQAVKESVSKTSGIVLKGEKIIGINEKVTKEIENKLRSLNENLKNKEETFTEKVKKIYYNFGKILIVFLIIYLVYKYTTYDDKEGYFKNIKYYYLVLTLWTLTALPLSILKNNVTHPAYLLPVSFFAVMITILINKKWALFFVTIFSLYIGLMLRFNYLAIAFTFFVGSLSIFPLINVKRTSDIINGFLHVIFINFFVALTFELSRHSELQELAKIVAMSFLNAIFSGVAVLGFLPIFEKIFRILTNITLIELSDSNLPLLRELTIKAPGTDLHSRIVALLAEKAALAVGANELIARVGALYHDIGKMEKARYFIENQDGYYNPHDKLSPNMSASIILSHVWRGIELAKAANLPKEIIEIIQQHHGTDLVKFFYDKAKALEGDKISEDKFRYSGPKPQTKEAGIIMLADAIESATRSLKEPTASRIKNMAQKIIRDKFMSGELDESELSMKDLNIIGNTFVPLITAFYHTRIAYSSNAEIEKNN